MSSALAEVARVFLRLGLTAFGGPAAHVALLEREVVAKRAWVSREEFLDLYAASQLVPGPSSTELALHLGYRRAGWPGLLVAGLAFILPAALLVTAIGWGYVRYGALPRVAGVVHGMRPVVLVIVLIALARLGRGVVKGRAGVALAVCAAAAAALGLPELAVLGVFSLAWVLGGRAGAALGAWPFLLPAAAPASFGLGALFLFFLKVGSVLFGSGYVLLAFLRGDLVERWRWLTEAQLLDAVSVGQITPGPLFTTATFVGYLLGGGAGALVATIGIFLPAFVFVGVSGWLVPRLRRSPSAARLLDGLQLASLGLMAHVTFELGRQAVVDVPTVALAAAALGVSLWRPSVEPILLLVVGGAVGAWLT